MVQLNSTGEIIDVNQADQMQAGKSQFECGYFACAMARSMSKPGTTPTLTVAQVIADAESWYAQYDGSDAISNVNGMTTEQEYELLTQIGLHFQATSTDIGTVKKWIAAGYPVIIGVYEAPIHDVALNANPYPWTPAGTHVILVTGVDANGNVLVRDSANCTNLYDPNSLRPGPRTYLTSSLQLVSATVVVPPWMPRPTSGIPPTEPVQEINDMAITINSPGVLEHFTQNADGSWTVTSPGPSQGKTIAAPFIAFYMSDNGYQRLGLPKSNAIALDANGNKWQPFERGDLVSDPHNIYGGPQGCGPVYYGKVWEGFAWTAATSDLTTQITTLTSELAQAKAAPANDAAMAALKQIAGLAEPYK